MRQFVDARLLLYLLDMNWNVAKAVVHLVQYVRSILASFHNPSLVDSHPLALMGVQQFRLQALKSLPLPLEGIKVFSLFLIPPPCLSPGPKSLVFSDGDDGGHRLTVPLQDKRLLAQGLLLNGQRIGGMGFFQYHSSHRASPHFNTSISANPSFVKLEHFAVLWYYTGDWKLEVRGLTFDVLTLEVWL
jgi:hypothetical protein